MSKAKIVLVMITDDIITLEYENLAYAKSDAGRLSRTKEIGGMWRQRSTEFSVNPDHVVTMTVHED